ncbi:zinc ABC transporter permease subunit ZnuB [Simiduia curdlanivorans]|uniref:High-affinity zinc uptake system membrane protein ZnuB n=1 Tax=Simiduia curdlanivorans TaxID=1492769 RepID=A0ABV8UZD0_9GAMM|nr:zinc ABC transporter permease subunit ZnuB [Simiduia curdlanivorans]MDN3638139.1 zinc ABC transporter permease subunit ZnuB [Simiduia curdlanivorans]
MPDFMVNAWLAGAAVAIVAGPLGSFAVWRRMAYFGDTLAHSALLGVVFGLVLDININIAVTLGCLILAVALVLLQQTRLLATDTLLGILSHSTLALGLVCIGLFGNTRVDLLAYLFGDLLTATPMDVITIALVAAVVLALVIGFWRSLISITVHEELARVEGVKVEAVRMLLMLAMALVIAIAMKVVGVLLITALLIIPAAAARRITHTPEHMAGVASLLGLVAVSSGLITSFFWDTPAGPSVVLSASTLFALTLLKPQR